MEIGFIGVGAMGGGLARNLIRAEKEVLVFDLNPEAVEKTLAAGSTGRTAESLDALSNADIVFTSLPMPEDLEKIMLGDDGMLSKMKSGTTYIDVSTIDPNTSRKLSDACKASGLNFLECPLGKTPMHAEKAEEPIFAGGNKDTFESVKPILEIVGSPVYYVGNVEAACAIKLISNLVGMTNVVVVAEAMRIGEKAGINPQDFLKMMDDTGAKSAQLNLRGPWIAARDFESRFGLDLTLKDLRLGCEMAEEWGNDAKTMKIALDYYKKASANGLGKEDCNAVYKIIN